MSSPSNNPGLLAGGRGWCGAGLLAAGAGQIPRLSLPSGFTEVTPAARPMQKIVKLREREGQGVDLGRSLKGHL